MPPVARAAEPCTTAAIARTDSQLSGTCQPYDTRWSEIDWARADAGGSIEGGHTTYDVPALALVASTAGIVAVGLLLFGGIVAIGLGLAHLYDAFAGM